MEMCDTTEYAYDSTVSILITTIALPLENVDIPAYDALVADNTRYNLSDTVVTNLRIIIEFHHYI